PSFIEKTALDRAVCDHAQGQRILPADRGPAVLGDDPEVDPGDTERVVRREDDGLDVGDRVPPLGEVAPEVGLSRTFDDVGRASPGSVVAAPLRQAASSTRARSNTNPARPYICRLIVFNRFTCPSTGPLLHVSVTAACTAASSRRMPSPNPPSSASDHPPPP